MNRVEVEKQIRSQTAKENTIRQVFALAGVIAALAYRRHTKRKATEG